jgi:hypothetical protein
MHLNSASPHLNQQPQTQSDLVQSKRTRPIPTLRGQLLLRPVVKRIRWGGGTRATGGWTPVDCHQTGDAGMRAGAVVVQC